MALAPQRQSPTIPGTDRRGGGWSTLLGWSLTGAIGVGGTAIVIDLGRALWNHAPLALSVAMAAASALLGVLVGTGLGLAAGLVALAARRGGRVRQFALGGAVAVMAVVGGHLGQLRWSSPEGERLVALAAFMVGAGVCLAAAVAPSHRFLQAACLVVGGVALALDAATPRWYYSELHDLLMVLTVLAIVGSLEPVRSRAAGWSRRRLIGLAGGLPLLSIGILAVSDGVAQGWRALADAHGLYAPALARALRSVADLDRDGASAVAWGGDCDDLDPSRHPTAVDPPGGGDGNCNGVDPPASPGDEARGLLPAFGEPNLAVGAIDLVLLVTVDSLRAEALRPDLMPRLSALGREGLAFGRLYSAGTRTVVSLPIVQRGWKRGVALADRLSRAGISSTLVSSVARPGHELGDVGAFGRVLAPAVGEPRWEGPAVTRAVLDELSRGAGGRRYVWAHYFDLHTPYRGDGPAPVPTPPGLHATYAAYASAVARLDRALGELFAGLSAGGWLARAVVIVTSDHGEAFGEHGVLYHAASAFEPLVRVPGLLFAPEVAGNHDGIASHQDLYPTMLGAFGLASEADERFGRSWWRLRGAGTGRDLRQFAVVRSAAAASGGRVMAPMMALVDRRFKLIKALERSLEPSLLFDLAADPAEARDLLRARPGVAGRMDRALELFRDIEGFPDPEDRAALDRGEFRECTIEACGRLEPAPPPRPR